MGALDNCHKTLRYNNMIDADKRYDSYTEGFLELAPLLEVTDSGKVIDRDGMKYAIMTHFYCSQERPKEILENNQPMFIREIGNVFPAGKKVMDAIIARWSDREEYVWTVFDGHTAVYRPSVAFNASIKLTIEGNDVRVPFKWYANGKCGNFRHLPANIIQSNDGGCARYVVDVIMECLPNHDEFGTHPNNAVRTRQTYHNIVKYISENEILDSILKEIDPNSKTYVKSNTATVGDKPLYSLS